MALQKRVMHASMAYSGPESTTQRAENWSHPAPAANHRSVKGSLLGGCPGCLFTLAAQLANAAHGSFCRPRDPALWLIPCPALPCSALLWSAVLCCAGRFQQLQSLESGLARKKKRKTLVHL